MPSLAERIKQGERDHGARFSAAALLEADPSIRRAYERGGRVKVTTTYPSGETWTRTGIVSTTTGWMPVFVLVHRRSSYGSSDVLGPRDRVVAVQARDGRRYIEASP